MATLHFHDLTVDRVAEELSDAVWTVVRGWDVLGLARSSTAIFVP
jgi:hypothetical protein